MIGLSGVCHFIAQVTQFYAMQRAQPAMVCVVCYIGVAYNLIADALLFDFIPNTWQALACLALISTNVIYFSH